MARLDFKLPDIGEGVAEAEIAEWHLDIGDTVKEGEVVASVMTDKATVEMEAPEDGTLLEKGGNEGDLLAVGSSLFVLDVAEAKVSSGSGMDQPVDTGPAPAKAKPEPRQKDRTEPSQPGMKTLAAPAVRRRAMVLGIDLADVPTRGELVRHEDLDRYLLSQKAGAPKSFVPSSPAQKPEAGAHETRVIGLRRQIAHRMAEAKRHIPHFTYVEEMDVTRLEDHRRALSAKRPSDQGLTILPFLCLAACRALKDFPQLNAHYDDEREVVITFDHVDLGIATQIDNGLLVPVLHKADLMNLDQLARGITKLAQAARSGSIGREDLNGSTFTMSSLGKLGGIMATPIINRPEVAILGPNRVIERIAMTPAGSAPRLIMNLSISCDHRIVDGFVAASFVQAIKRMVEDHELSAFH